MIREEIDFNISFCLESDKKKRRKNEPDYEGERFHFVVNDEFGVKIAALEEKTGLKLRFLFEKTEKLFLAIWHNIAMNNLKLENVPGSARLGDGKMDYHFNITLPEEMNEKLKYPQVSSNSFSMAQIMRIYLISLVNLLDKVDLDELLERLEVEYDELMKELLKINSKRKRCVQLNGKTWGKGIIRVLFDRLMYPIFSASRYVLLYIL